MSISQVTQQTRGFTLIEVLIAMVIFSVGFLGLSAITMTTIRGLSFSNKLTTATTLAQDKLEEIKMAGYRNALTRNYPAEAYTTIPDYPQFQRTVIINPDTPVPDVKTVIVMVSWGRGEEEAAHTITLSTMLGR